MPAWRLSPSAAALVGEAGDALPDLGGVAVAAALDGIDPDTPRLRVLERLGSIIGLIIGAVMIDSYGYQNATGIAGIGVCAASIIFILFFFIIHRINPDETETRP